MSRSKSTSKTTAAPASAADLWAVVRALAVHDGLGGEIYTAAHAHAPQHIETPADAAKLLRADGLPGAPLESFGLFTITARHAVISRHVVSTGCLTSSLVHPREVFRFAILDRAAGVVLWHNHPSGDPEPGQEDHALTARLCSAGALLGIPVLDHVVVAARGYYSFKNAGRL